ncbi:hypothetical protein [Streptomyces chiangmaiensis]|uniref:Uncharacterized protein n=1 Tax=Streptomyces chiangmaiensis TaxID=766497 RepID=A0ABU7FKK4_9ACTN|nr:hypothetical protein [Streptomyces chiangmaiensis]MED7824640.1 hypothetical protein [Streptomyces chiangmaiensis]
MTRAPENRFAVTATVVSLAAEAAELETRVNDLRHKLADLDERMRAISDALHVTPRSTDLPDEALGEEDSPPPDRATKVETAG